MVQGQVTLKQWEKNEVVQKQMTGKLGQWVMGKEGKALEKKKVEKDQVVGVFVWMDKEE